MKNEENHNTYQSVGALGITVFKKYKYLTENDEDIVKLKQQAKEIVKSGNL